MMMKKYGFLIIFSLLWVISGWAQSSVSEVDLQKLDDYFQRAVNDWDVPGMSVGIVKDGEIIFSKGYGVKEVGKDKVPDGNTLFAIASNTKAFTSAIIATLVQEGKLDWDDKVRDYLPGFELYGRYESNETTILDLLCHRVGLGTFSGDFIWYKSNLTAPEIVERVKYLPKRFDFRAGYGYSNVMYITAGEVIKVVTGKTWGENIQERLLDPIGLERTIYSIRELEEKGNYATPHALEGEKNVPIPYVDWEEIAALGGLISSANDMCKWMMFNLEHGIVGQDTILTPASRNTIWAMHNSHKVERTKENDFNNHFSGYGLGWGLADYYGNLKVSHGGGFDGMISSVNMVPDKNLGVVVLTNGMNSPTRAVTYYALEVLLGQPEKDWSAEMLEKVTKWRNSDTRIKDRKKKRVEGTNPSLGLEAYEGAFKSDIYGKIYVGLKDGRLHMAFEHTPELDATLTHWHYDVWKLDWRYKHAWFDFGTVKFNIDNNLDITGLSFDVPNNDIFFEELKPYKIKKD